MPILKRLGISVVGNLVKALLTFATGMVLARHMGPEQYGMMVFLLGTFIAVRQLLDLGTSTAFFTFLSRRQRGWDFIRMYFAWLAIQFLVPFLIVAIVLPDTWIELVWKSDERSIVLLAFVAAYMQSVLWTVILQMGESQRQTHWVQGGAVAVSIVNFLLVLIFSAADYIDIKTVYFLTIFEWIAASIVIVKRLKFCTVLTESDTVKSVLKEFVGYCTPLIPYAWVSFVYEFVDRWLLQTYGGGVEQAYYAVSYQFASVAAIATASVINIFWKEVAEAHNQSNIDRVSQLYRKFSNISFFTAAAGACFLAPWADKILGETLGAAYVGGGLTLMIMSFYPLHQSIGQLGGAMAYATGNVRLYVRNGITMMMLSVVMAYFVLADNSAPLAGLGLGSEGLAVKMIFIQVLSVNVLSYYLTRSLGIKYYWKFQPLVFVICCAAGFVSYEVVATSFDLSQVFWPAIILSGLLYFLLLALVVSIDPGIIGMNKFEFECLILRAKKIFAA